MSEINLKSKNCPYCDAPRAITFTVGDLIEHQCGTTRQKRSLKTVKRSGECLWRVHAAKLASELNAAQARIAELESAPGWQPIKTAPKDGTRILVLTENGVDLAWWAKEFDTERNKRGKWVYRGAWTNGGVESWGMQENIEVHPTHWMPLPATPQ